MTNQIFLYGIAKAEAQYRVVRWLPMDSSFIIGNDYEDRNLRYYLDTYGQTIRNMKMCAAWLKNRWPNIERVYAIDNCRELCRDYKEARRLDSIESNIIFVDILEKGGTRII